MNDLWKKSSLVAAGWYNILAGAALLLFPNALAHWAGLQEVLHPFVIQVVGLLIGCFGFGFLLAARAPLTHWPVVLAGLTSKILAPIGLAYYVSQDAVPSVLLLFSLPNDIIWLLPFGLILYEAFELDRRNREHLNYLHEADLDLSKFMHRTNNGHTLDQLSRHHPVLLVFLRHFGCTFCRETLATLARDKELIEKVGTKVVLVHMIDEKDARKEVVRFGVENIARISDPEKQLYDAFGLHRGSLKQLFGWKMWLRGADAGVLKGHWVGFEKGDGFQMPGVFLLQHGQVTKAYRHHTAADTPDYRFLATPVAQDKVSLTG
ncbi:MAG: SelL-related redox protein [Salibacteraceae bacterium]